MSENGNVKSFLLSIGDQLKREVEGMNLVFEFASSEVGNVTREENLFNKKQSELNQHPPPIENDSKHEFCLTNFTGRLIVTCSRTTLERDRLPTVHHDFTHIEHGNFDTCVQPIVSDTSADGSQLLTSCDNKELPLHDLCSLNDVAIEDLQNCLFSSSNAPFLLNHNGQTPLHVWMENFALWDNPRHCMELAIPFSVELIQMNPAAVTVLDSTTNFNWPGRIILERWIEAQTFIPTFDSNRNDTLSNLLWQGMDTVAAVSPRNPFSMTSDTRNTSSHHGSKPKYEAVNMIPSVEGVLQILSIAITNFEANFPFASAIELQEVLCCQVATDLPKLFPTILFVEPEQERRRILELPFIRRLSIEPKTVGPWLVFMMRQKGLLSRRAVDYLLLLSENKYSQSMLNVQNENTLSQEHKQVFEEKKKEVFQVISNMGDFILSFAVLEDDEVHRATSGNAIWHIMHQGLRRPFVFGMVLIDFILHITLMLSFRADVTITMETGFLEKVPSTVNTAIIFYFLVRKISEGLALWNISNSVFRAHVCDFWHLFDLISIVLVVAANSINRGLGRLSPSFNAVVLALLWLKVLAYIRAINMQMATFILSLVRIVLDIRYFLLVFTVFVMMFGDVMTIIYATTLDENKNKTLCQGESDAEADFCSGDLWVSYLRMYGLLLGDFAVNDYRGNEITTIIFVFFTIFGIIILLNFLIAFVSESYEKSKIGSKTLFAKARIGFLAEHLALEHFLMPGKAHPSVLTENDSQGLGHLRTCVKGIGRSLRVVILLYMLMTILATDVYLFDQAVRLVSDGGKNTFITIGFVCMSLVIAVALWTIINYLFVRSFDSKKRGCVGKFHLISLCNSFIQKLVDVLRHAVFGDIPSFADDDSVEEAWQERLDQMKSLFAASLADIDRNMEQRINRSTTL